MTKRRTFGNKKATGKPRRRGRGRPFVKGDPRAGRPLGCKNKASAEIKLFAAELLDDPDYMIALLKAWKRRKVHNSIEQMFYHYRHGRPVQAIDMRVDFDPGKLLADLARKDLERVEAARKAAAERDKKS
jgi:hypothetical protein